MSLSGMEFFVAKARELATARETGSGLRFARSGNFHPESQTVGYPTALLARCFVMQKTSSSLLAELMPGFSGELNS